MAQLEPTMFREYDLRGRVDERELNPYSVGIIASAYGTMLRSRGIDSSVVGYDLRTGSRELSDVAINALRLTGVNVIALGQILTPIMYSAQYYYQTLGGMMITASHNPNGWLGFKLCLGYSSTLGPDEMQELRQITVNEAFEVGVGSLRHEQYIPAYTSDLISRIKVERPIKVLVNTGNGTAGPIVPDILRAAGCEVAEFLTEPDLAFRHYFPNPALEKMMQDTGEQTVINQAAIGLAIDGDGDRLGVTDENGQIIWPDRYLILLSREILKQVPGAAIVFDANCSRALGEDILTHGGKPCIWKTGHSYIKAKMRELNSPLAGEMSGHIFFGPPTYKSFDDAVFAGLKLIELLSQNEKPFSELVAKTPQYCATPTIQASCPDKVKYEVIERIVESFIQDGYKVVLFDNNARLGGRVEFPDGWFNIRASSNLPVISMRFEARSDEILDELQAIVRKRLRNYTDISLE
jgi:phosphomannomutase / phosphoglucomutase